MLIKRMGLIYTRYVEIVAAGVVYTWFVLICGCGEDFWALISLSSLKNKTHEITCKIENKMEPASFIRSRL